MPKLPYSFDNNPDQLAADYVAKLPVQLPEQLVGIDAANAVNNLFAPVNGVPRFQTWPEVMIRSGATLPLETYQGKVPTNLGLRREDFTDIPQERLPSDAFIGRNLGFREGPELGPSGELISRTQDLAGLAGGGSIVSAKSSNATLGSGPVRLVDEPKFDMFAQQRQHHQGIVRSDTAETAPLAALERAPVFYSAVENAVKNAKMTKGDADQWLGYIRNQPGVKTEELDWVLHELPKGQITKGELEEFINGHKISLEEVNKGKVGVITRPNPDEPHILEVYHPSDPTGEVNGMWGEIISKNGKYTVNVPELPRQSFNNLDAAKQFINEKSNIGSTAKYSQWQLPGGENYREMLMTLPERRTAASKLSDDYFNQLSEKYGGGMPEIRAKATPDELRKLTQLAAARVDPNLDFKSSHWSEPNVLAHVRTNERNIPGVGNSLHIEEIQSDWHQKGRKEGYKLSPDELKKLQANSKTVDEKLIAAGDRGEEIMGLPDIKEAIETAIDYKLISKKEGEDYLKLTRNENSNVPDAPFKTNWPDLALKRVIRQAAESGKASISWTPGEAQAARYDLSKHVNNIQYSSKGNLKAFDKNGNMVIQKLASEKELSDIIGKDAAEKLIAQKSDEGGFKRLNNADLKIGGEGMKAFYDKMLVDKVNAIAKKFGGKVEQNNIEAGKKKYEIVNNRTGERRITDSESEAATSANNDIAGITVNPIYEKQPIHVLRITPQLRDAALNKGFSLFADTGKVGAPLAALTRVEHNPFKLTPVDHNPFTTDAYHGAAKPFEGIKINPLGRYEIHKIDNNTFGIRDKTYGKNIGGAFKSIEDAAKWADVL